MYIYIHHVHIKSSVYISIYIYMYIYICVCVYEVMIYTYTICLCASQMKVMDLESGGLTGCREPFILIFFLGADRAKVGCNNIYTYIEI